MSLDRNGKTTKSARRYEEAGMVDYQLTSIEGAIFDKDRSWVELSVLTDVEPLKLKMESGLLDDLILRLEEVVGTMSLFDPLAGPRPNEPVQIRMNIVDYHQITTAFANGIVNIALGLGAGPHLRWYGLDAARATAIQQALETEVSRLLRS